MTTKRAMFSLKQEFFGKKICALYAEEDHIYDPVSFLLIVIMIIRLLFFFLNEIKKKGVPSMMTVAPSPPQRYYGSLKVRFAPHSHSAIMFLPPLLIPGTPLPSPPLLPSSSPSLPFSPSPPHCSFFSFTPLSFMYFFSIVPFIYN